VVLGSGCGAGDMGVLGINSRFMGFMGIQELGGTEVVPEAQRRILYYAGAARGGSQHTSMEIHNLIPATHWTFHH